MTASGDEAGTARCARAPTAPELVMVPCAIVLTVEDDRIATGYLTFDLDLLRRHVGAWRG
jgi:hypothetical protein